MSVRFLGAALATLTFVSAAHSQPNPTPTFSPEAMKADVTFLADDLLEGRDSGSRGHDIASRFVASRFEALGLKQAVKDSWYQPVTLSFSTLDPQVRPVVTIGGTAFPNGGDSIIGPFGREPKQALEAQAVFVGFGLESAKEGIDDYAGLDVRGKYVVALAGSPMGMPNEIGAHLAAEKSVAAERHGAIGLITLPTLAQLERRPWERMKEMSATPSVTWIDTDGQPYVRAPGIRGSAIVNGAAADALFAGSGKNVASIRAMAAKKGGQVKGFTLKPLVTIARTSTVSVQKSQNVVAILPGSDPTLANEYVLLMAHLDHIGVKPEANGADKIYNGAMDNASGVATMLAVAKAFADNGVAPKRSILFAAVTAEEKGLLGAQYLARHPVVPVGDKVVGVVNLDMPILTYDFQDVVAFGAEHSTLGPIVERAAKSAGIALSPDPLPAEGLFTRSDHYRFVQEGVPSVFLMTGFAGPGKAAFEHFLKTDYHQPSDQIDLPFHWNAAAKFAQVNYLIAREIADAPSAPLWYVQDFFGDAFAPDAPKAPRP
jgi:Zn-dependent M28 family amino/carboxypeptidase